MKKLSGILATGLAFSLVFGMTAFAAGSKNTGNVDVTKAQETVKTEVAQISDVTTGETVDLDANEKELQSNAEEAKKVADKQAAIGVSAADKAITGVVTSEGTLAAAVTSVPDAALVQIDQQAAILVNRLVATQSNDNEEVTAFNTEKAFDLTVFDSTGSAVSSKITVSVKLDGVTKKEGFEYFLMHLVGGVWKAEAAEVSEDGTIKATVSSFSPFILVSYKTAEKVNETDSQNENASNESASVAAGGNSSANGTVATSPKTADSIPAAAFAVVLAAAGMAAASRKIRITK